MKGRQAYARLLMDQVRVTDEEIRISGSKSVLARCTAQGVAEPVPKVLFLFRSGAPEGIRTYDVILGEVGRCVYSAPKRVVVLQAIQPLFW
jgi:hypothetical protein